MTDLNLAPATPTQLAVLADAARLLASVQLSPDDLRAFAAACALSASFDRKDADEQEDWREGLLDVVRDAANDHVDLVTEYLQLVRVRL